jgi:hypothetical protein
MATMCQSCQDVEVFDGETMCEDCDWLESMPSSSNSRIETCRRIVSGHGFEKIDGIIVDTVTANLLVTVYDALNEANQAKFDDIPLVRLVDFAWSRVK